MRGFEQQTDSLFVYISPESFVPKDHPLRPIRQMVDAALDDLSPVFCQMYSHTGRPSVPPEQLLKAMLLQVLYRQEMIRARHGIRSIEGRFRLRGE